MRGGVLDDLGGRIEAHRQAVQQAAVERGGFVALQPGRDVDQKREARGMGFRETVLPEALDLLEDPLGEIPVQTAFEHAV